MFASPADSTVESAPRHGPFSSLERPSTSSLGSQLTCRDFRDYIYEGAAKLGVPEDRQFEPRHEIVTLDDYRQRYNAYHGKDASLRAMRAAVAWQAVPDDHEVSLVAAVFLNCREADPSRDRSPTTRGRYASAPTVLLVVLIFSPQAGSADQPPGTLVRGVTFSDRKRNAFKAYFENMPIRQVSTTDDLRTWRQFRIGKLADLNMLDTRQCESGVDCS